MLKKKCSWVTFYINSKNILDKELSAIICDLETFPSVLSRTSCPQVGKRLVRPTVIESVLENKVLWELIEGTQHRDQRRFPKRVKVEERLEG